MTPFTLDDWRQLPAAGKPIGITGKSTRLLWEWALTFRVPTSKSGSGSYPVLQHESEQAIGNGKQVKKCTVSSGITAVGQTIALACDSNPTKVVGSECLLPRLKIMLDGYWKVNPATRKKLPKLLVKMAYQQGTTQCQRATVDLTMVAFYYLLRVGEYTVKRLRNNTKQTVQFKYEDVTFFKKNNRGELRCLPRDAPAHLISSANGATLKLVNQKNGWKGVCVYHESNGEAWHCPVRALTRRHIHLRDNGADTKTFLSAYYDDKGQRGDITNEDVSKALKAAATVLEYPMAKGVPDRPH